MSGKRIYVFYAIWQWAEGLAAFLLGVWNENCSYVLENVLCQFIFGIFQYNALLGLLILLLR